MLYDFRDKLEREPEYQGEPAYPSTPLRDLVSEPHVSTPLRDHPPKIKISLGERVLSRDAQQGHAYEVADQPRIASLSESATLIFSWILEAVGMDLLRLPACPDRAR